MVNAAPPGGGPVEDGPDQRQAAGLAGQPADDLDAAAGLAEGALDEVGVPDPVISARGEAQVDGQAVGSVSRALDRGGVGVAPAGGELVDALASTRSTARSGRRLDVPGTSKIFQ